MASLDRFVLRPNACHGATRSLICGKREFPHKGLGSGIGLECRSLECQRKTSLAVPWLDLRWLDKAGTGIQVPFM